MTDQGSVPPPPPPYSPVVPGPPAQPQRGNKGLVITLISLLVAIVIATVVLIVVLLTGSDDDEPSDNPTGTATSTPTPTPGTDTTPAPPTDPAPDPNPGPGTDGVVDEQLLLDLTNQYLTGRVDDDCGVIGQYATDEFLDRHTCAGGSELGSTDRVLQDGDLYDAELTVTDEVGDPATDYSFFSDAIGSCSAYSLVYVFEGSGTNWQINDELLLTYEPADEANCQ